jgi:hypothetical protein
VNGIETRNRISMCYLIYKNGKLRDLYARPREDFQSSHLFGGKLFDRQSQQSPPQVLAPALIRAGASDKCQRSVKTGHFFPCQRTVVHADFVDLSHPIREVH